MAIHRRIFPLVAMVAVAITVQGGEIHMAIRQGNLARVKSLLADDPSLLRATNNDFYASLPIHLAAQSHTNVLAYLLTQGVNIEATNGGGFTPLQLAASHGNPRTAEMLLKAGASTKPMNPIGTALHIAAQEGSAEVVQILLRHGASVDAHSVSNGFDTPLFEAAKNGHRDIVELLIAHGAEKDFRGFTQATPLISAAALGRDGVVQSLLAKGANINAANNHGYTPLYQAIRYGKTNCAKILLEHKAHLDLEDEYGLTPLGWCLQNWVERHSKTMEDLLRQHGATNAGSFRRKTGIHEAAGTGDIARVRELVKERPELVNSESSTLGGTPLFYAAGGDHVAIAKYLIDVGAEVNRKDLRGWTSLHNAAKSGSVDMVKLLSLKKADVNAKDADGRSVLHLAVIGGSAATVKELLAAGAVANTKDKRGASARDMAIAMGRKDIADLLKQSLEKK